MHLGGRTLVAAAIATAFAAAPAAAQIQYTTTGSFGGTCSGTTCTVGGITITFNGASSNGTPVTAPSFVSFGSFQTTGSTPSGEILIPFTLTIHQTAPSGGSGSFSTGTISGVLTLSSSTATFVAAAGEQVVIGSSVYSWFNTTYALVPPTVDAGAGLGVTTLQGQVATEGVVPEPASLLLLGTGLLGLGRIARRGRRRIV